MKRLVLKRVLLTGLLLVLSQACSQGAGDRQPRLRPPTSVVTETVLKRPMRDTIEAIGTAVANESLTITSKVTETVRTVAFEDGDFIDAGAVLVELTNQEETALLAEAKATVEDTSLQQKRLEDLYEQRAIPVSDVDVARARANEARARYESIVARLDDRLIRAPFSGVLGFRQVSPGTLVTPGTAICTLDDIEQIKLDFAVPEVYLALLEAGLTLTATSPAYPGDAFSASVETVGSRIDPVSRTAQVRALIDNEARRLRPGMLLTVQLSARERVSLAVPEVAVVQRSGAAFVYVVEEGADGVLVASLRQVRLGSRYQGWAEVLDGIEEQDRVVTDGVIKVRDGAPIKLLDRATVTG